MANTTEEQQRRKESNERERLNTLKILENSYIMQMNTYETHEETARKMTDKNGNRLHSDSEIQAEHEKLFNMVKDTTDVYIRLGGKKEDLEKLYEQSKKKNKNKNNSKRIKELLASDNGNEELDDYIARKNSAVLNNDTAPQTETYGYYDAQTIKPVIEENTKISNDLDESIPSNNISEAVVLNRLQKKEMYDIVTLPSNGECYPSKQNKVKVAYLTAFDENMILSPNLYKDGSIIDFLLEKKILDCDIDPSEFVQGDRDAIVLWLRGTGYGVDFPIVAVDDKTGKEFDTTVDLSKLKYKPFKLKGDKNGHFDFTMPTTGDIVKFKFLTQSDVKKLNEFKEKDSNRLKVANLRRYCSDLNDLAKDDDLINADTQLKIRSLTTSILDDINKKYDADTDVSYTHELTDRLLLQTVSVNGVTDRQYVRNYITSMNVRDAKAYRDYMRDNEPGVDYNVEIERPLSLGGGSMNTFLQFDQFIFITV